MQFWEKNTEVFLFAQFLRCVPSFAAIGPFEAEIWTGPPRRPSPSHMKLKIAQYS